MISISPPPATPIKVGNGYHATGSIPDVTAAKLTPQAFPGALPKALGYVKDFGNMNTYKVAAHDGADAAVTFRAIGSVEQAVKAASLLAAKLPAHGKGHLDNGATASYVVLAHDGELFVIPLWSKNPSPFTKQRIGIDVDWRGSLSDGNEARGTAARATDPMFVAAVGSTRWIDVR